LQAKKRGLFRNGSDTIVYFSDENNIGKERVLLEKQLFQYSRSFTPSNFLCCMNK